MKISQRKKVGTMSLSMGLLLALFAIPIKDSFAAAVAEGGMSGAPITQPQMCDKLLQLIDATLFPEVKEKDPTKPPPLGGLSGGWGGYSGLFGGGGNGGAFGIGSSWSGWADAVKGNNANVAGTSWPSFVQAGFRDILNLYCCACGQCGVPPKGMTIAPFPSSQTP